LKQVSSQSGSKQVDFSKIVKKAYDKAINDKELTLLKLLEDLKTDLKHII